MYRRTVFSSHSDGMDRKGFVPGRRDLTRRYASNCDNSILFLTNPLEDQLIRSFLLAINVFVPQSLNSDRGRGICRGDKKYGQTHTQDEMMGDWPIKGIMHGICRSWWNRWSVALFGLSWEEWIHLYQCRLDMYLGNLNWCEEHSGSANQGSCSKGSVLADWWLLGSPGVRIGVSQPQSKDRILEPETDRETMETEMRDQNECPAGGGGGGELGWWWTTMVS